MRLWTVLIIVRVGSSYLQPEAPYLHRLKCEVLRESSVGFAVSENVATVYLVNKR